MTMLSTSEIISLENVSKTYGRGSGSIKALRDVSVAFLQGSFTAIMGPSGSGKSTLMQCAAGLDTPSSGTILLGNMNLAALREPELTIARRDRVGFVFQAFNLVPTLTARQNIELPLRLAGRAADKRWFDEVVRIIGIKDRLSQRPAQLSGGQQQRVAIARALIGKPEVVFADEPTGALDTNVGREILALLRRMVDEFGQTTVMVTHDPNAAAFADRVLFLADGTLVDELTSPDAGHIAARMTSLEGGKGARAHAHA